jgi:hypothetical protein
MSGWMINVALSVPDVQDILDRLPDTQLRVAAGAFSLSFPDGVVAYGSDASPDTGTDITVKGPAAERARQIYRHLELETSDDVVLWMMNDGAVFEAGRGTTAGDLGL